MSKQQKICRLIRFFAVKKLPYLFLNLFMYIQKDGLKDRQPSLASKFSFLAGPERGILGV